MSLLNALFIVALHSLIRSEAATHLGRLLVAADARALELAQALEPATIKALHAAVEDAAAARLKELSR